MKILLSVAVWGSDYVATLSDYSLASQLSPENIPRLAGGHQVTYHIAATQHDARNLRARQVFSALRKHCEVVFEYIEESGYDPKLIPRGAGGGKYSFLSRLQNIAIRRSLDFDVLVFNYADFIWADGSLSNVIKAMGKGADAVLSFALPVGAAQAKVALAAFRTNGGAGPAIDVPPRQAAGIAIDCLHGEAKLRLWDGPRFSRAPTYLLWPVADQGLLVRAYHQTVLALRVRRDDPEYAAGIRYGSLDGYFTAHLGETANVRHAADSDKTMVFSLYDAKFSSALRAGQTREQALRSCLRHAVSASQRRFAEVPICVKRREPDPILWDRVGKASWNAIEPIQRTTPANPAAFESTTAFAEALWRSKRDPVRWLYLRVMVPLANGWLGDVLRRALGEGYGRTIRSFLERRLSGRLSAKADDNNFHTK